MIRAYDEVYLDSAQVTLGTMLDFAVHELGQELEGFWEQFLDSGLADRFGKGDYQLITGRSGVELAYDVLERTEGTPVQPVPYRAVASRSPEYWAGWALAYYQWRSVLSFRQITGQVPIRTVVQLYHPYHEMDILQFCDRMDQLRGADGSSRLKRRRCMVSLSQSELSELAQVPLRTLQKYEQKSLALSQASFETVFRLAQVLQCAPLDLIERD